MVKKIITNCDYCNREFEINTYEYKRLKHHFCSKEHYYAYKRNCNHNEFILKDDYAIIIVKSPKYGIFEVKIDIEDVEKCKQYYWTVRNCKQGTPYFCACTPKVHQLHLHRYLMNCPENMIVDHINTYDHLDNRKSNLRITDVSTNTINIRHKINNTSGYKNISYENYCNRWVVHIQKYKKVIFKKRFKTLEEAIIARDNFIKNNRDLY